VRLPRKSIEVIQVIEYLRAFLIGREAWGQGNMLMIISGAFGVFRTDRACGRRLSTARESVKISIWWLVCTAICCSKVRTIISVRSRSDVLDGSPLRLKSLGRQRARWEKGLLDVLWPNRDMLFQWRYGRIGCLALPYLWLF